MSLSYYIVAAGLTSPGSRRWGSGSQPQYSFDGILPDGSVKGPLFPASIVLSRGSLYVTNLALPLTPAIGDEPEEDVTTYTVSRVPLQGRGR